MTAPGPQAPGAAVSVAPTFAAPLIDGTGERREPRTTLAVPAEVLTSSLFTRFRSRQEHTFAEKVLSAMREKFGGHTEKKG